MDALKLAEAVSKGDHVLATALAARLLENHRTVELVKERLGAEEITPARLHAERNRLRFEATLLAKAWREREVVGKDEITKLQIDALAEQHYRPGELEPLSMVPPHPWRMTSELAEALTNLTGAMGAYQYVADFGKDVISAAERVYDLLCLQIPPICPRCYHIYPGKHEGCPEHGEPK